MAKVHTRTRRNAMLALSSLAIILTQGCTSTQVAVAPSSEADSPAITQDTTQSESATQTSAQSSNEMQSSTARIPEIELVPFKTHDSYAFVVDLFLTDIEAIADITNAPPGKADLTISVDGGGTAKNTTSGRTAPPSNLKFGLAGLWPSGASICTLGNDARTVELTKPISGKYCEVPLVAFAYQGGVAADNIGVGGSIAMTATWPGTQGLIGSTADSIRVSESEGLDIVRSLEAGPTVWILEPADAELVSDSSILTKCDTWNIYGVAVLWSSAPIECRTTEGTVVLTG